MAETIHIKAVRGLASTTEAFRRKLVDVANRIGCNPDYLATIISFESAGSFSPSKKNAAGSGAVGLIQFMPSTALRLGTSTAKLAAMTAEKQLDYVEKYFASFGRGRLKTLEDLYMAVLWPAGIGQTNDFVLWEEGSTAYQQNKGFDHAGTGAITKEQVSAAIRAVYTAATSSIPVSAAVGGGFVALVLFCAGAGYLYFKSRA